MLLVGFIYASQLKGILERPKEELNTQAVIYTSIRTMKPSVTVSTKKDKDDGINDDVSPSETQAEENGEGSTAASSSNNCSGDLPASSELSCEPSGDGNGANDTPCENNSAEAPQPQGEAEKPKKGKGKRGKKPASNQPKEGTKKDYDLRHNYKGVKELVEREKEGVSTDDPIEDPSDDASDHTKEKPEKTTKVTIRDGLNTGSIPSSWIDSLASYADVEKENDVNNLRTLFNMDSKCGMSLLLL